MSTQTMLARFDELKSFGLSDLDARLTASAEYSRRFDKPWATCDKLLARAISDRHQIPVNPIF
jgi:hypothetical protein